MTQKFLRLVSVGGFLVIAALLVAVILFPANPPAPPPMPNPNGYDDFVKAGTMVTGGADNPATMDLDAMRAEVAANAPALKLAREGLQRESRVPIEYSMSFASNHLADLAAIKRLALAFYAAGRLAERENRDVDASNSFLDAIQLGQESARGGISINRVIAEPCHVLGFVGLQSVAPRLSAAGCGAATQRLEAIEEKAEPVSEVLKRQQAYRRRTFGIRSELEYWRALLRPESNPNHVVRSRITTAQNMNRRLLVKLAARAYELEKGQRPKTVGDLVPAYLKTVPKDPVTGTNLVLTPQVPATR